MRLFFGDVWRRMSEDERGVVRGFLSCLSDRAQVARGPVSPKFQISIWCRSRLPPLARYVAGCVPGSRVFVAGLPVRIRRSLSVFLVTTDGLRARTENVVRGILPRKQVNSV